MKKFKTILALLLVLVMCLSLCSCGNEPGNEPSDNPQPQQPADTKASLQLTMDEWPVIDGATAFLPYYTAVAAKLLDVSEEEANQLVLCSTTDYAYPNLVDGKCDAVFCLRPSDDQIDYAECNGVEFEQVPILSEGFVFFVNKDNPVNSITIQQLHDIYAGKITNWKQVGGNDEPITAYQRTEGSGSQTGLYLHVIDQDDVMEPPTEKRIASMGDIIDAVASYENASGAIGYSYYYFVVNQHFDSQIKMLEVEGVEPNMETISSGKYPMISDTCIVFRSDEPEDSVVRKIADWCLSDEGQQLGVAKGYVPRK